MSWSIVWRLFFSLPSWRPAESSSAVWRAAQRVAQPHLVSSLSTPSCLVGSLDRDVFARLVLL